MRDATPRSRRRSLVLAAIGASFVLGAVILVLFVARWMLFPTYATVPDESVAARIPGLERVWIDSPQGRVEAWFLPGQGVSAQAPGPAVFFAHGNAELIEHWPGQMSHYRRQGVSVLLAEYRGYGRSAGSPSQAAITEDFIRFYDSLAARPEVDAERIVLHGRSLGGAAVGALAAHRTPAAIILQSTFTRFTDMVAAYFVPAFLVLDPFDTLSVISAYRGPVLVVHGRRDSLIPYSHGQALAEAAPDGRLVTYDSDHNDCPPDWGDFWRQVDDFLEGALKRDTP